MNELKDRWFWAYPTESVDCDGITGSAHEVYSKSDVDAAIDELKTENESLLQQNRELCLALQVMYSKEEYDKLKAAHHKERHEYIKMIAELKRKLEDAKATAYAESVDAGMENRRLKRALWLARAEWARSSALSYHLIESHPDKDVAATYKRKANKWEKVKDKCLKKAEEYK